MEEQKEQPKSEMPSLVDRAEQVAKRLEEAFKRQEEIMTKQEQLRAREILGGGTLQSQPIVKKEETPQEYVKRVMSGKA